MIYDISKEIIVLIFLVIIVNLLVIPSVYKKLIMFYLQFMVVIIILKPVIRIMGNEVTSSLGFNSFVTETMFDESVKHYQDQLAIDLETLTYDDVSNRLKSASKTCLVDIEAFTLSEKLEIKTNGYLSTSKKACLASEMGLVETDIIIMEEEVNE